MTMGIKEAVDSVVRQLDDYSRGRAITIQYVQASRSEDGKSVVIFTEVDEGHIVITGFDIVDGIDEADFEDHADMIETAFLSLLILAWLIPAVPMANATPARSALNDARDAFDAKWPVDLQLQVLIERVAGGDYAAVFDELQADREHLKSLARAEPGGELPMGDQRRIRSLHDTVVIPRV